jgi:hypothetical protein
MDNFFSFYYITQWAAIFNNTEFARAKGEVLGDLSDLRSRISCGEYQARRFVSFTVGTDEFNDSKDYSWRTPETHGWFLSDCQGFLSDWHCQLRRLKEKFWKPTCEEIETDNPADLVERYPGLFCVLTDKLVLETLQICAEHWSSLN